MADFALRLRELRQEKNLSQLALANQLGLARTTIANYEQGTRFTDQNTLCGIADFFGVSLDYLLGRTDIQRSCFGKEVDLNYEAMLTTLSEQYMLTILKGDRQKAYRMIFEAVGKGISVKEIYLRVLEPSLHEMGHLWETLRVSVAQEHHFTASTKSALAQLYPYVATSHKRGRTIVGACIHGELHDVGLSMVLDFFEMDGWNTYYLGAHTPTESIIRTICTEKADLVALSVTMMNNLDTLFNVIREIHASPACRGVKVLVGGYVFNRDPELWKKVGADGYGANAEDALRMGTELIANTNMVAK